MARTTRSSLPMPMCLERCADDEFKAIAGKLPRGRGGFNKGGSSRRNR